MTRQGSARSMSVLEKDFEEPVMDPEVGGDGRMISERPTISGISERRLTESRGLVEVSISEKRHSLDLQVYM